MVILLISISHRLNRPTYVQRGEFGQLVHLRQTFVVFLRDDNALFVCSTVYAICQFTEESLSGRLLTHGA